NRKKPDLLSAMAAVAPRPTKTNSKLRAVTVFDLRQELSKALSEARRTTRSPATDVAMSIPPYDAPRPLMLTYGSPPISTAGSAARPYRYPSHAQIGTNRDEKLGHGSTADWIVTWVPHSTGSIAQGASSQSHLRRNV